MSDSRFLAKAMPAVAGAGLVALVSVWLHPPFSLAALYAPLVLLATWQAGLRPGLVLSAASTLFAMLAGSGADWVDVVDALTLGSSLALCAGLVARARAAYVRECYLARHDALTGALNRRAFHEALGHIAAKAVRSRRVHILLYIDLDGFKAVNDAFGHDAGDAVLKDMAQAIAAGLEPDEPFARVGGDEFVALVAARSSDDPYTQVQDHHERLSAGLGALGYDGLGCSMGAVLFSPPVTVSREALLHWADALMYEVKRAGKGSLRIGHAEALAA